jgi:pimeloyl-ACP methyl ester carboxylesterase
MSTTFVLVHGAWHAGWCWDPIVPALEAAGHSVEAVDLPFTGPDDDVAHVVERLDAIEGRKVCAFAPEAAEDLFALIGSAPTTVLNGAIGPDGDYLELDTRQAVAAFYAKCAPDAAAKATERLRRFRILPPLSEPREPAWKTIPSTYVVCTEDAALHPELQRRMAKRCTATVELDTDHSPFLSTPDELARILLDSTP